MSVIQRVESSPGDGPTSRKRLGVITIRMETASHFIIRGTSRSATSWAGSGFGSCDRPGCRGGVAAPMGAAGPDRCFPKAGVTTAEQQQIEELEREVRDIKGANVITKVVSIFFAPRCT
jgi:hypothetical protein